MLITLLLCEQKVLREPMLYLSLYFKRRRQYYYDRPVSGLHLQVHPALMEHPIATSGSLVGKTGITPATVNKALGHLEQLGIVKELTARKRNRLFSYAGHIEIISRGTELPGR